MLKRLTSLVSAVCGCEIGVGASVGKFVLLARASGVILDRRAVVGDDGVIMREVHLWALPVIELEWVDVSRGLFRSVSRSVS